MDKPLIYDLIPLVARRIGLSIGEKDRELFRVRILSRMKLRGETDPNSYAGLLSATTPEAVAEWQELVHLLTTGESYFFRDQGQHELLRNSILPRLLELRQEQKTLRIWSAGCATGEEPYSVAMLLNDLLATRSGWRILIMGTDINSRALDKARRGVYSPWSFRMVNPAVKARYFTKMHDAWELDKKIRDMVTFRQGNLVEDRFPAWTSELHSMDLILCRNVFIYFSPETVAQIVEKFSGVLNEGGYLVTGHGEVTRSTQKWFTTLILDDHVLYRKITDIDPKPEPDSRQSCVPTVPSPVDALRPPSTPLRAGRSGQAAQGKPLRAGRSGQAAPDRRNEEGVFDRSPNAPGILTAGERNEPDSCESEFLKAQAAADAGRYEESDRGCRAVLERAPTFAPAYLLLAQLAEAHGNLDEAQESLKKALFLKHDHVAACLELGRIYALKHDARRAEQMYAAAMDLLRALPAGAAVETYRDVTAGELLRHLEELQGEYRGENR